MFVLEMKKIITLVCSFCLIFSVMAGPTRLDMDELQKVDFSKECTTSSDPSSRLYFENEWMVTNFMSAWYFNRLNSWDYREDDLPQPLLKLIYSHDHFETHLGTRIQPRVWSEDNTAYRLTDWGMVGNVRDPEATVFFLSPCDEIYTRTKYRDSLLKYMEIVPDENHIDSRKTDPFEVYALAQLKKGEKLVRWERPEFMRAMGSIRAEAICMKCHTEVKEGDVLGAFIYEYAKTKAAAPFPKQKKLEVTTTPQKKTRKACQSEPFGYKKMPLSVLPPKYLPEPILESQMQSLDEGIVSKEMLAHQAESRRRALKSIEELVRIDLVIKERKAQEAIKAKQ